MKAKNLVLTSLLISTVITIHNLNLTACAIEYNGVTAVLNGINLSYGTDLVVQNSNLTINGNITGQGKNGCYIRNSTIYLNAAEPRLLKINAGGKNLTMVGSSIISVGNYSSFSFAYAAIDFSNVTFSNFGTEKTRNLFWTDSKIRMENVTFSGVGNYFEFTLTKNCLLQNIRFTELQQDLRTLVILNSVSNSVLENIYYEYTLPMIKVEDAVGFYVGNCNNITFSDVKGMGMNRNVDTPHQHICAGRTSSNITVKNSYFRGGGNGAEGGIAWLNCTFDGMVDGIEGWVTMPTYVADCIFRNIIGTEINLQSGLTWNFVRCTFSGGKVNLSNGTAVSTNCTFPNGMQIVEYGDNKGGKKYAGTVYQFWNFTRYTIGMKTTWKQNINTVLTPLDVYSGFNFTITGNDKPLIMLTRTS